VAAKVDDQVLKRMEYLHWQHGLNARIIGERLGLSTHTVQIYLRQLKKTRPECTTQSSRSDG
jgi:DNA-binding transcriptional regulator LsrR (DeoR family)